MRQNARYAALNSSRNTHGWPRRLIVLGKKLFRNVLVYRLEGSECHGLWYCWWMKSDMVQLECWLAGVQLGLTCSLRQPSVSLITVIQWICIKIMVHGRISILVNHSMNINFNVLEFLHTFYHNRKKFGKQRSPERATIIEHKAYSWR